MLLFSKPCSFLTPQRFETNLIFQIDPVLTPRIVLKILLLILRMGSDDEPEAGSGEEQEEVRYK